MRSVKDRPTEGTQNNISPSKVQVGTNWALKTGKLPKWALVSCWFPLKSKALKKDTPKSRGRTLLVEKSQTSWCSLAQHRTSIVAPVAVFLRGYLFLPFQNETKRKTMSIGGVP